MRRFVALLFATMAMLAASIAAAESPEPTTNAKARDGTPFAITINSPTSWFGDKHWRSYGASAYLGIAEKRSLRLNVASYDYTGLMSAVAAVPFGGPDDNCRRGHMIDVGLGHQWFTRRLWDGFSIDTDLLVRHLDGSCDSTDWNSRYTETVTTTIAARAMVGWTWALGRYGFVALSAGLSYGVELGREDVYTWGVDAMLNDTLVLQSSDTSVVRDNLSAEALLRFGVAIGR